MKKIKPEYYSFITVTNNKHKKVFEIKEDGSV